jgi:heme-degrading monooxygenase HmoA
MDVRMNMFAGDPARIGELTRYLEATARPNVEGQHGNRGLACLANASLGVCMVASYWENSDAMSASEQAVQVSRKEMTELLDGTVTVEHYEVPAFVRLSRPAAGAGVRLTRLECPPAAIDGLAEEFRSSAVPALMDMAGLCSAHMLADRATGRCVVITAWEDEAAMAASRGPGARLRASMADRAPHVQFRGVEEYTLLFSSVREGDTRNLIERGVDLWNSRDRAGWLACFDLNRLQIQAPGGFRLSGQEAADTFWSTWQEAYPDNRLETTAIHADDRGGAHEGRFLGTHTGALRGPAGEIPATGKVTDGTFTGTYEIEDGKVTSYHLYFDQLEVLSQLGITPPAAAS